MSEQTEKQTTTWYMTGGWRQPITPMQVEKETAQFVVVNGRRKSKESGYYRYFRTEAEAVAFLVRKAQRAVAGARHQLQLAERDAEELRARFPDAPEWQTEPTS